MNYRPGVSCPEITKFLDEILEAGEIPMIQEFAGYCLLRDYPSAKALLLVGDGENGMSTFTHLTKSLAGRGNYSPCGLQELESNRFGKAALDALRGPHGPADEIEGGERRRHEAQL